MGSNVPVRNESTMKIYMCLFFPIFLCFNFCRYSPVMLYSNVRHLSFIYGGN